jgi:hypothetical protein
MTTIEKRHLHLLACSFCSLVPPGKLHEALTETDQYTGDLSPVKGALRPASFAVDLVSALLTL